MEPAVLGRMCAGGDYDETVDNSMGRGLNAPDFMMRRRRRTRRRKAR
jgi:hypothetical protein